MAPIENAICLGRLCSTNEKGSVNYGSQEAIEDAGFQVIR
jgi:hypothetical protein